MSSALRDLPPASKLVFKTLEYDGEMTQQQLCEETRLTGRTVRNALGRLEDANAVDSRFNLRDARQRIYSHRGEA